ncbi:MAG: carboxypeptidase regulatory-like domain-containing protein [Runella sp.]
MQNRLLYQTNINAALSLFLLLTTLISTLVGLSSCTEGTFIEPKRFGSIVGQVVLFDSRKPVEKAIIRISPVGRTVETDANGNFRFDSLTIGRYTVQASKAGFRLESFTTEVQDERTSTVNFFFVDDQTQNRAPEKPSIVAPLNNATNINNTVTLRWKSRDPDRADSVLTYDVYFFREGQSAGTPIAANLRQDSLTIKDLAFETTYYWQIVVRDRFTTVFGEVWSFRTRQFPDLAYVYTKRVNGSFQIFASNDGIQEFQLTQNGSNWRPIVSPNRQEIAFISNVETDLHLYVMNVNGTRLRKVTSVPVVGLSTTDLSFCWSPDGSFLLYPSGSRLFAVRSDGTGLRTVAQAAAGRQFAGCDWTDQEGGRIIARTTGVSVYDNTLELLSANGERLRSFVQTGRTGNPVFSIDGKQILFTRDVRAFENPQGRMLDSRIFLFDLTTNVNLDLSAGTGSTGGNNSAGGKPAGTNDLEPRFSPNGAKIIFTNTNNDDVSPRNIIIMDANGGNRQQFVANAQMPYWR